MVRKNKKQKKIFKKIFWPVVIILLLFTMTTLLLNYFLVDKFVKDNAKAKIEVAYNDIVEQIKNYELSKESIFKLKLSKNLINLSNNTKVYVFDANYKEVTLLDDTIYIDSGMTDFLADLLINFELEESVLTTIRFNGREYLANVYETNSNLNINEKYFVIVQDLTDKAMLLKSNSKNMLIIQIFILMLTVATIFIIARDLSKPIIKLAIESENYEIGKGITIDSKELMTEEIEVLRKSLFKMQERIDLENNKKNTIYENIAHDLRTPLVSILGYADGLKNGIIKDKNKACDIILKTGTQLKEMIENILLLSRFDNDTYKGMKEEISLIDIINEQIEVIKAIDKTKQIIFENKSKSDGIILTDKKLVIRIMQNLLSNAIKYANKKIIIILESIKNQFKKGINDNTIENVKTIIETVDIFGENNYKNKYSISIVDDGIGIEDNDIKNIFNRYYKGVNGHFGIGLAAVKSSIEYLGGGIDVKSKKNKGTTFTIKL